MDPTPPGVDAAAPRASEAPAVRVAIVIVSFESQHVIESAVCSALAACGTADRVIVWDNASSPECTAVLSRLALAHGTSLQVHLHPSNIGFAGANNAAAALVPEASYVLALNPDAVLAPDALGEMVRCMDEDPALGAVGAVQLLPDRQTVDGLGDVYHASGLAWRSGHGSRWRPEALDGRPTTPIFGPCAAAALYRRAALLDVGGFDEAFFCYFEDVDLAFRLQLAGWRCARCNDATVIHVGGSSAGANSDFAVYHGHRNLAWSFFKNMPASLLAVLLPLHLAMSVATLVHYTLRGRGRVMLRAKRDAMLGLPRVLRIRRQVQAKRRIPTRTLWRLLDFGLKP